MAHKAPTVEKMTPGQLKLHFGSLCQHHQCNGVSALGYASKVPIQYLRSALITYETHANREEWDQAEDALLSVVAQAQSLR